MLKNLFRLVAGTAVIIAMVSMITAVVTFGQDNQVQAGGGRLEGAWNVRVSILNCQTGAVIRSFDSVTQFMDRGTLIDSTSGMPQALKTPGQGVWEHTTGSNYRFKFKSFGFDAAGNYTGYTVIQHDATLDSTGSSYESSGTAEVYAPNGVLVATLCSSTTATRFGFGV